MYSISSNIANLFFLLLIGCFAFSSRHRRHSSKKNLFSSIKRFFSFLSSSSSHQPPPVPSIPSPSSSTRERLNPPIIDICPCSVCGEIFHTSTLLQHHQSTKHAVSELFDGENIVRIIFKMGWPEKAETPTIHRILKIHNAPKIVARFEEYRESVKSRAAKMKALSWNERCIADGNELLRFHSTTFICSLQESSICSHQYCSACGIIRSGFSQKMDGITTLPTSWRAHSHRAIPEDEHVKRALLVCRVIAGRISCFPGLEDPGFDSLVGPGLEEELLVFSPRAVLPCFVILYAV